MLTKFSIIIPSARAAASLNSVLLDFEKQTYPSGLFEVIVVRNNEESAIEQVSSPKFSLRIIRSKVNGPSAARNLGIYHSSHDVVICLDDDCTIEPNFLHLYHQAWLKFPQATIIGGKIYPLLQQTSKSQQLRLSLFPWCFAVIDYGAKARWLSLTETLMSANLSFRKKKIPRNSTREFFSEFVGTKISNKSVIFGEDWELCLRVHASTGKIAYYPKIKVGNQIEENRFKLIYLARRFWLAGIERYRVEVLLTKFLPKILNHFDKEYLATIGKKNMLLWFLEMIQLVSYQLSKLSGIRYTTPRP